MAGATATLKAEVGLDGRGFETGLNNLRAKANSFASGVAGDIKGKVGGLFTLGAATVAVSTIANYASKVRDVAQELGITTDQAQAFEYILNKNNATIEDGVTAFNNLEKARKEALENPDSKAAKAFEFFGVEQKDLTSKNRFQLMEQISADFQGTERTAEELTNTMEIFGSKLASKLRPALEDGFVGAVEKAKSAGAVADPDALKRVDEANKKGEAFIKKLTATGASTAGGLLARDMGSLGIVASLIATAGNPLDLIEHQYKRLTAAGDKSSKERVAQEKAVKQSLEAEAEELKKIAAQAKANREANAKSIDDERKGRITALDLSTLEKHEQINTSGSTREDAILRVLYFLKKRTAMVNVLSGLAGAKTMTGLIGNVFPTPRAGVAFDESLASWKNEMAGNELDVTGAKQTLSGFPGVKAQTPTDALMRVGNFLGGSGQQTIIVLQQRGVDLLKQIEANTRPTGGGGLGGSLNANTP